MKKTRLGHRIPREQQQIAARRAALPLDQKQLAAAAGCSPSTISKIERGEVVARPATLNRILKVLDEQSRKTPPKDIGGGFLLRDALSLLERADWLGDMHPLLRNALTLGYRPLPPQGEAVYYQFSEEGTALGTEAYRINLFLYDDGRPGALELAPLGWDNGDRQAALLVTLLLQHGIGLGVIAAFLRARVPDRTWQVLITLHDKLNPERRIIDYGESALAHATTWACKYIEERFPWKADEGAVHPIAPEHRWAGFEHVITADRVIDAIVKTDVRLERLWEFLSQETVLSATNEGLEASGDWINQLRNHFREMVSTYEADAIAADPALVRRVVATCARAWAGHAASTNDYAAIYPQLVRTMETVFQIVPGFEPSELPALLKAVGLPPVKA